MKFCGNVHFPPNGVAHYDYGGPRTASSSYQDFGLHDGPGGNARSDIDASAWAQYLTLGRDCGGEFLIWWLQNMPSYQSEQTFDSGLSMLPIWPALSY